jgi:hypothetical protein
VDLASCFDKAGQQTSKAISMNELRDFGKDRYLAPGTKVISGAYANDDEHQTYEVGIVVHCWLDDEIGACDCYIAFFGSEFPTDKPSEAPYILRYAAMTLAEIVE